VTVEQQAALAKAKRCLEQASLSVGIGAWEGVSILSYTAAFHAAQVYVFDPLRRVPKTHSGLKGELHRVAHDRGDLSRDLVGEYGRREYQRNEVIYSWTPKAGEPEARDSLAWAERFVAEVERVLS